MDAKADADPLPLAELWRQELLDLLERAARDLTDSDAPVGERVHAVRQAAKKGRSLLKLAPRALRKEAGVLRVTLRQVRRQFGAARDARVSVTLVEKLPDRPASVDRALREACEQSEATLTADLLENNAQELLNCRTVVAGWTPSASDSAGMIANAAKSYRAARKLLPTNAEASEKALHAFRSAVVDHRYQMALFARLGHPAVRSRARDLQKLRERLGLWLDGRRLDEVLSQHGAPGKRRKITRKLERILALADRLFEPRTRELRSALAGLIR
jgi:CHAD domain-containing protein